MTCGLSANDKVAIYCILEYGKRQGQKALPLSIYISRIHTASNGIQEAERRAHHDLSYAGEGTDSA
jgi:hypothetical protein